MSTPAASCCRSTCVSLGLRVADDGIGIFAGRVLPRWETPPPEWIEALQRDRVPRGEIVQRAVAGTTFSDKIPGLPEGGNYAVVTFRSSFANQTEGVEAVTLEVGADYGWHVIGYAIQ